MAEAFPVSGNIEPASFPHLLVDLHRHGATGSLKVTGPLHPKALYFRGGRILFGSSNDPRDQLGAILTESGRISREQLEEVNGKVGPGNPLAKVLEESGFVTKRELGDAARVKVERILADMLSWEAGSFEFEDGILPKNAPDLKLSTERLLLAATQGISDRAFALRHVELSRVLEPAPEGEAALSAVRAEVWPLLERLDGRRTLKDAVALTRLDEFQAVKTACALLFLGIVRPKAEGGEELDLAEEAERGFGAEPAPSYAPPVFETPPEPEAAPEATGFAFAEPEPPRFAEVEPEPVDPAQTAAFPFPPAELLREPTLEPEPFSEPFPPPVPEATVAIPDAPSFTMEPPRRKPTDTVPGDRPVYVPPPPEPEPPPPPTPAYEAPLHEPPFPEPPVAEPVAPEIGTPAPAPASRPTQEDLAALDALLNPSASGRLPRTPVERPQPERWEPRPATTPPRRAPVRPAAPPRSQPSRTPVLAIAAIASVGVATLLAWYFFLRAPAPKASTIPVPAPTTIAAATPLPTAEPTVAPTIEPAVEPSGPATPPATPEPTPVPTPRPTPVTAPAGDAHALLRQGSLPESAQAFAASLAPGARDRFSLQLLVACAPENVTKAVGAVPSEELFILPVSLKGRACYRLCWGVYEGRAAAEGALSSLPAYFRQGGGAPRIAPLVELLP